MTGCATAPAGAPRSGPTKPAIVATLVKARAAARAKAVAEAIVARVKGGASMEQAFAAAGVKLPAPQKASARQIDLARQDRQVQLADGRRAVEILAQGAHGQRRGNGSHRENS